MVAIDIQDRLKELYQPTTKDFSLVDVPEMQFVMIDGKSNPEGPAFLRAVKWLFTVIFPIKRIAKERMGKHFVEPPLEALWWADDMNDLITGKKDQLKWRAMIVLPHWLDEDIFRDAIQLATQKLGDAPASLRRESITEGHCVQIMHKGPNADLRQIVAKLHQEFLPTHDLVARGHHHEIYLNDSNRVAPEKLKTILRQPVQ
ncbi:GyrI-like domain-containing protein [Pseudovibrio sp. Tun.PSC04-5.I4]|uniref:GyrI-like domain-containing protein n=1 Tax=Pseudovibrio sp. Tun.PSC04-5.I4 TaxID=1798213 RepID=UPI00088FCD80|nr:GyrI-like domain-containing protein [Pseudovibrio sp. Tun.PSC04-5.I4]SDR29251.1 hypothetical protein SAMN04515695_4178 [Pseudovibrio sp. Tun.PSC04-5.I4]